MTTINEDKAHAKNISATEENGVLCALDNVWVHSIPAYLNKVHPEVSLDEYKRRFPDGLLYSPAVVAARARQAESLIVENATVHKLPDNLRPSPPVRKSFAEVFGLGKAQAAKNARGEDIMIDVLGAPMTEYADYVPALDKGYVFNIDILKSVLIGFVLNKPVYAHGKHGTGKTTVFEQFCARTNRPLIRVQHTVSTEEAHVLGHYVVKGGDTVFEPGPLAIAMRYGLVYLADEYDFALPSVTSVYQPVLEGKQLIIKEASPEWRVVKPHPNFRFVATGNTNGSGDETGLYQGTQIQNAANYSRFGITIQINYMDAALEGAIVASQGGIPESDALRLVQFATDVRAAYGRGDIGLPVSPRELIGAADLSRALGGKFRDGIRLAFTNRLSSTDAMAVDQFAQRIFAE